MINGYSNPYDILSKEYNLPFFVELSHDMVYHTVLNGKKEANEHQIKLIERILGVGLASSLFAWAGSHVIKDYYKKCQGFIEEEVHFLQTDSSQMVHDFKMSLVLFAAIGKYLDIIEFKSTEIGESVKLILKTIKHLSLTEALKESIEEDLASGKYSKWFEFSMSSFFCLLAHCWKCFPTKKETIMEIAKKAGQIINDNECTIDSLCTYRFNTMFLDDTVEYYLRYRTSDIKEFGNHYGSYTKRKELVDEILSSSSNILSEIVK